MKESNAPPRSKKRSRSEGMSEPKSINESTYLLESVWSLQERGAGKLFYSACCEELSLIKNIIVSHIASNKHNVGK